MRAAVASSARNRWRGARSGRCAPRGWRVINGDAVKPGMTGLVDRNGEVFKRRLQTLIVGNSNRAKIARQSHR